MINKIRVVVRRIAIANFRNHPLQAIGTLVSIVLTAAVLVAISCAYVTWSERRVAVYVASRDLHPYNQIGVGDVKLVSVEARSSPLRAPRSLEKLIGSYSVSEIEKGAAFDTANLGPVLPTASLEDRELVEIAAPTTGFLEDGDTVSVTFATSKSTTSTRFDNVLVLASPKTGSKTIVAVKSASMSTFVALLGTSQMLVSRQLR